MPRTPRKIAFALLTAAALAGRAVAALVGGYDVAMPVARVPFQAAFAGQMQEYFSLTPSLGLARLQTLAALPVQQFPALAVDRAAAQAALTLIVSPNAADLTGDRKTRVLMSRALGKENVAAVVNAAQQLKAQSAVDPGLSASVEKLRAGFVPRDGDRTDIAEVSANLKKLFDQSAASGFTESAVDGGGSLLIPVRRPSGLVKAPVKTGSGLVSDVVAEGEGFVSRETGADGRTKRRKIYPKDAVSFERREIPSALSDIYEELPGGAVRQKKLDPLAAALDAAKIDLWTVRHGETETNRAHVLAGSGTDAVLTRTSNENGTSGEAQARAAAQKMYDNLGGDAWASSVLAGFDRPVVILVSPLKRARQTAAAFTALLDHRRGRLGADPTRPLYEVHVERGLAELSFGGFEGRSVESARALGAWPAFDGASGTGRDFLDRFPNGESRLDVLIRQRGVLRRMIKDYSGRRVVAFGHYETAVAQKAILGLLDRDPKDNALHAAPIPNAEPIRLTFPGAVILGAR